MVCSLQRKINLSSGVLLIGLKFPHGNLTGNECAQAVMLAEEE